MKLLPLAVLLAGIAGTPAFAQDATAQDPMATTAQDPMATTAQGPMATTAQDPAASAPSYGTDPAATTGSTVSADGTTSTASDGTEYNFTGLRAEFLGGYNRLLPDQHTGGQPVRTTSRTPRHSGGIAGIQGGYDIQLGPVVAGLFGGYSLQTANGCGRLIGNNEGCLRPEAQAEGGARVGFQYAGRFLVYGKGSYVNTRIQTSTRDGAQVRNSHINKDGWRVGGGVEFGITPHAYIKAEYDYTRTERFNAAPYGYANTRIDYHSHSALGGVGIRF